MPFVLEGIVTTLNEDQSVNLAPMGPIVNAAKLPEISELLFRPFPDSRTCENLLRNRSGVFHTTDDIQLYVAAVTKQLDVDTVAFRHTKCIDGVRLTECCHWFEFNVTDVDTSQQRVQIETRVVAQEQQREFIGFNRARHAVLEGCILATRLHLIPVTEIEQELSRIGVIISKTAGENELQAWKMLEEFVSANLSQTPDRAGTE